MIAVLRSILNKFGYNLVKKDQDNPDIRQDQEFMALYEQCRPFTMTSIERMYSLYSAVHYILDNKIEGDLVECGVWKGGSSMLMALILSGRNVKDRKIYLYDTFEGMSEPTIEDKSFDGHSARMQLDEQDKNNDASVWCFSPLQEVNKNLASTGLDINHIVLIKGKVEDTLIKVKPQQIALLRLDTDWYESTKTELEQLYPLLSDQGVLIIDDFGHWEGAKKAVLEYFGNEGEKPLLSRIDYTGRMLVKGISASPVKNLPLQEAFESKPL